MASTSDDRESSSNVPAVRLPVTRRILRDVFQRDLTFGVRDILPSWYLDPRRFRRAETYVVFRLDKPLTITNDCVSRDFRPALRLMNETAVHSVNFS